MKNETRSKTIRYYSHSLNKKMVKQTGNIELTDLSEGIVAKRYYQASNDSHNLRAQKNNNHLPENPSYTSSFQYLQSKSKLASANLRNSGSQELPYIYQSKNGSNTNLPQTNKKKKSNNLESFRKKIAPNKNSFINKVENKKRPSFSIQSSDKKELGNKFIIIDQEQKKKTNDEKGRRREGSRISLRDKDLNNSFEHKDICHLGVSSKKTKSFAFSQTGKKQGNCERENQDSYVCLDNIFDLEDYSIYGIMDGHGSNGHLVSQFIKRRIEEFFSKFESYLPKKKNQQIPITSSLFEDKIFERLQFHSFSLIKKFYQSLNTELGFEKFDVSFSGSTCVLLFKTGRKLIIANTGDSRAILVKENRGKQISKQNIDPCAKYEVEQLSIDQKPDSKEEKMRIEKAGGYIAQYVAEDGLQGGPFRVWVKGEKYPGIAMSRSIGDHVAKDVGVICEPEINVYILNLFCKYVVVASDGVWDFLSNEEVMDIVNPYFLSGDAEGACEELVKRATEMWNKEEDVIDDITVVIGFIGHPHIKKGTV